MTGIEIELIDDRHPFQVEGACLGNLYGTEVKIIERDTHGGAF